jgi:hypothetical protein
MACYLLGAGHFCRWDGEMMGNKKPDATFLANDKAVLVNLFGAFCKAEAIGL